MHITNLLLVATGGSVGFLALLFWFLSKFRQAHAAHLRIHGDDVLGVKASGAYIYYDNLVNFCLLGAFVSAVVGLATSLTIAGMAVSG